MARLPLGRLAGGLAAVLLAAVPLTPVSASAAQEVRRAPAVPKDPQLVALIKKMSLEQKVGQLFVTHAYGDRADTTNPADVKRNQAAYGVDNADQLIAKYHLGGVIYFAWSNNVNNPQQIASLSNGIQRAGQREPYKIPLITATDQEGGKIVRIQSPATQFPGNMAIGASRKVQDAFNASRISGRELRAMGIVQNYAPDADVNVNPANPVIGVRSFGADPRAAAGMTAAAVLGLQSSGVAATAKHFPGHGDTDKDSHTEVPYITHSKEQWERLDLPPFRAAIKSGIESIMTGHLVFKALDPSGDPATLSRPILTGQLRERLGYDGLVITDSLGMQGVRDKYGDDRIPVLALKAGVDQLLKPPDGVLDLQYNAVLQAVRSGELTESRIDESVYRVLRLKKRHGLFRNPYVDESAVDRVVGAPENLKAAQRIADPTTTLIRNDDGRLPLTKDARKVLVAGSSTKALGEELARRNQQVTEVSGGTRPTDAQIADAVAKAEESDLVFAVTSGAWNTDVLGDGQLKLVKALLGTGRPVILVTADIHYDVGFFPDAKTAVATYSTQPVGMAALAKVLFKEASPQGRIPVAITDPSDPDKILYPIGHGLSY